MTKRTPKPPPTANLPSTWVEAEAVDTIAGWIDRVADLMTSEEGRRRLRESLCEKLKAGAIPRMQVIAAAEAGDQDADHVLRALYPEYVSRRQEPPPELAAFYQRAMLRAPASSPPGRNVGDIWKRDLGIAVLVQMTMGRWHLPRTRGRVSKNPDRLSACYLVGVALGRRGINLGERGVEKISLGHVEGRLAERLSAFLSPV